MLIDFETFVKRIEKDGTIRELQRLGAAFIDAACEEEEAFKADPSMGTDTYFTRVFKRVIPTPGVLRLPDVTRRDPLDPLVRTFVFAFYVGHVLKELGALDLKLLRKGSADLQ